MACGLRSVGAGIWLRTASRILSASLVSARKRRDYTTSGLITVFQSQPSLIQELKERGLVHSITGPEGDLEAMIESRKVGVYAGIDPTASSLHVGHLLCLTSLLHFYLRGHHSVALIGKATASVGDPSGRATERDCIEAERLQFSFASLWRQIERFFQTGRQYALERGYDERKFGVVELVTNADWLDNLNLIEFLRCVGGHVRVSQMLARETVKARMDSSEGINFAEFTYQLLQSYDFWHLYRHKGCRLQIGGNDQFGNITAGIDMISRLAKFWSEKTGTFEAAYGLTVPLLTTSSGKKIGKSIGNAVWLDEKLTSPFELYQYFVGLPDNLMHDYLGMFTLLPAKCIEATLEKHKQAPHVRAAQNLLAQEVVSLIHGSHKAVRAAAQTQLLFSSSKATRFDAHQITSAFSGDNRLVEIPKAEFVGELLSKLMRKIGLAQSRAEAESFIKAGGVYIGQDGWRVTDATIRIHASWLLDGAILLIRLGKSNIIIVKAI